MSRLLLSFFFFVIFSSHLQAQLHWRIAGKSLVELKREQQQLLPLPEDFLLFPDANVKPGFILTFSADMKNRQMISSIPLVYQYEDLAFFCRIEVQLEQLIKLPVKFRLGEVQYVEQMEGKY